MSTTVSQTLVDNSEAKTHAIVAYVLLLLGLFTAIPMLIGAIWAMVKKKTSAGTIYHSHYTNAIRTFWWLVAWTIIGLILIFVMIGYVILGIVWVWALYRLVTGLAKITSDLPYAL